MSKSTDAIRGRCLCAGVEFELQPPSDFCAHCHCESCRLSHGAAFVTWTSVAADHFRITAGGDLVRWYRSSDWIEWGFCGRCGSSMLYRAIGEGHAEAPKLDRMYVTVASLTEPLDREPSVHVSYEERAPWHEVGDGLPKHRGKTDELME